MISTPFEKLFKWRGKKGGGGQYTQIYFIYLCCLRGWADGGGGGWVEWWGKGAEVREGYPQVDGQQGRLCHRFTAVAGAGPINFDLLHLKCGLDKPGFGFFVHMCLEKGLDQLFVYRGINKLCIQCHNQLIWTIFSRDGQYYIPSHEINWHPFFRYILFRMLILIFLKNWISCQECVEANIIKLVPKLCFCCLKLKVGL